VWIYTCTTVLSQTTTNTVTVTAYANGLKAIAQDTITVNVALLNASSSPALSTTGAGPNIKIIIWEIMSGILVLLIAVFIVTRRRKPEHPQGNPGLLSRTVLFIVFGVVIAGVGYYFLILPTLNGSNPLQVVPSAFDWKFPVAELKFPSTGNPEYSNIPAPGGAPSGLPVRLLIPLIGVDSGIEDAYITPDGRMQVPSGTVDVAWFALGPHPGQVGSAVIGGHFGIQNGIPFVFYSLNKLAVGDKVYVVNDEGGTLSFIVRSIASFGLNDNAAPVFTSSDGLAHLNLITCEGIWNAVDGDYPDRLVIFTDEIPTVAAAPTTSLSVSIFSRSLGIGASGPDVSALQTALEQKGFLTMPPAAATGYFGALTAAAVSAYQTSAGLPPVGVFGPLTRAKLISQLAINAVLPATGIENSTTLIGTTVSSPRWLVLFMESLDATPLEGFIFLLLFCAIVFMVLKIMKR
jgi:peptidoglycan hydrolase-like protein with peptidoglycan-binding domain